ncbi:MAG: replication-associated recombination protein A, partial [Parcubacteria group bacterium]|nr:replication-associated recombination protein A [Parcubacteria group bacterium]
MDQTQTNQSPLADRMRPQILKEFVGQEEIIGEAKLLKNLIEKDEVPSLIFWGPPGVGKTTLAKIIAKTTKSNFIQFSATSSGLADLRKIMSAMESPKELSLFESAKPTKTILFIDEIHRWNKAQQDALLPHVEKGAITLIGATTENPSFEINSALLSRCRVFVLKQLETENIIKILKNALEKEFENLSVSDDVLGFLANASNGDARTALNALELAIKSKQGNKIDIEIIKEALQKSHLLYDRAGDEHFNIISALHKSMRGSDADASLYWLGRMLEAGEDPLYVARRLVRFASEDIGLADPNALIQAVTAYRAAHFIGMPECNVILAQAVA